VLALAACSSSAPKAAPDAPTTALAPPTSEQTQQQIVVTSTAFKNNAPIPRMYTCDGAGTTPPIKWTGIPAGTISVAVVVDDPDAPVPGGFVHWVVLDLPPTDGTLPPVPGGAREAKKWTPPCPPSGTHHYRFTVYALRLAVASQASIEAATIAKSTLVGTYRR